MITTVKIRSPTIAPERQDVSRDSSPKKLRRWTMIARVKAAHAAGATSSRCAQDPTGSSRPHHRDRPASVRWSGRKRVGGEVMPPTLPAGARERVHLRDG